MTVALNAKKIGKTLLILTIGSLISSCSVLSVAVGVAGVGVSVATTAVGVGVSAGTTAISATTTVVKAAIPGD